MDKGELDIYGILGVTYLTVPKTIAKISSGSVVRFYMSIRLFLITSL